MNECKGVEFCEELKSVSRVGSKKILRADESFVSTRDESLHRSFESTGKLGRGKKKARVLRENDGDKEFSLAELREKLRTMHRSLPKIPKSPSVVKIKNKWKENEVKERIKSKISVRACRAYMWQENKFKKQSFETFESPEKFNIRQSFCDFHNRSKILLYQLEQKILSIQKTHKNKT